MIIGFSVGYKALNNIGASQRWLDLFHDFGLAPDSLVFHVSMEIGRLLALALIVKCFLFISIKK